MTMTSFSEKRLAGRTAIVTGGGYGIGKAYAHRLAGEGAQVVVAELDGAAGEAVAKDIAAAGLEALAVQTDVGEEASVVNMVAKTIDEYGKVDVLVNNAAMFTRVPVENTTVEGLTFEHFEKVLRVNVLGTWLCARTVIPDMRKRQYGKIINISSGTAFKGSGGTMLQYVTSKSALFGFTRSLARTVGPDGIRVNCVAPGATVAEDEPTAEQLERAQQRAALERAIAKVETPEDIVGIVAFLSSADSDFITGQTIVVDGGAFMH
jgi:3-oxoacyl-[acyl-carrier protein] reductase